MENTNDIATSEQFDDEALTGYACELTEVAQKRVKPGPKGGSWTTATYEGILVGRNKVIIKPDQVYGLAELGLKNHEIATFFGVTEDAISRHFAAELQKGREYLKLSLRRAMIRNAIDNNNAAVSIFLAKNILGMSDAPIVSEDAVPLPWIENADEADDETN